MIKKCIFGIIIAVSCLSCGNDDDSTSNANETSIDLVTGLLLRQGPFDTPTSLGNPNSLDGFTIAYPVPTTSALSILDVNLTQAPITDVWVVRANAQKLYQNTNFTTLLNSDLYTEEQLNELSELTVTGNEQSNIILNLEDFSEGYYRVFIKRDNQIFWHNIYKGSADLEQLFEFWQ